MKLLLNVENVIVDINSNIYEFELGEETVLKTHNGKLIKVFGGLNSSNATIVNLTEVQESIMPKNPIEQYVFVEGEFRLNPLRRVNSEEANFMLYEFTGVQPNEAIQMNVENRVEAEINYIKNLAKNNTQFLSVSQDLLDGFDLMNEPDEVLTEGELAKKQKAIAYKQKLTIRYRINAEVGDVADLISDYGRQVNLLTGMIVNLILDLKDGTPIPEEKLAQYLAFCRDYRQAVDSQQYFDRSDIEEPQIMVPKLLTREAQKARIVQEVKGAQN